MIEHIIRTYTIGRCHGCRVNGPLLQGPLCSILGVARLLMHQANAAQWQTCAWQELNTQDRRAQQGSAQHNACAGNSLRGTGLRKSGLRPFTGGSVSQAVGTWTVDHGRASPKLQRTTNRAVVISTRHVDIIGCYYKRCRIAVMPLRKLSGNPDIYYTLRTQC